MRPETRYEVLGPPYTSVLHTGTGIPSGACRHVDEEVAGGRHQRREPHILLVAVDQVTGPATDPAPPRRSAPLPFARLAAFSATGQPKVGRGSALSPPLAQHNPRRPAGARSTALSKIHRHHPSHIHIHILFPRPRGPANSATFVAPDFWHTSPESNPKPHALRHAHTENAAIVHSGCRNLLGAMEEARLLESLQHRLADLDRKVHAYRHDMEADFLRYYHDLLGDVSPSVAVQIRQSLAKSLINYPTLSLDLDLADSRTFARPGSGQRHHSPPTVVSTPGSGATDPPGSPHDKEEELQGLFTPSYLPLLDSSPRLQSPPVAVAGPSNPSRPLLLPDPGIEAEGQGADMGQQGGLQAFQALQDALPATPQLPTRPGHVRQSTDDTTSSVLSDRSDVKTPRSALRRSSSSSKPPQSPRRVRFDFMGAEVLPTASPQATDFMTPSPVSPTPSAEPVSSRSMLHDDFEDQLPPRKISSSEALRALSRAPLDSGTVWTVVNPHRDEILIEQEEMVSSPWSDQNTFLPAAPEPPMSSRGPEPLRTSRKLGSVSEEPEDVDEDNSSDEEFLSMAKPKSFTNKQVPTSPSPTKESHEVKPSAHITTVKSSSDSQGGSKDTNNDPLEDFDAEEDDMFHFEAGGLSAPPRPRPNPLPVEEEEEEVVEEDLDDVPEIKPSLYATSPAVHIARPSTLSAPTTPTMAKFQAGSLGSYKGRPIIMPVVRNPDIHAQAASLGQFNTFVGGLDGRSGMDEGDLNSFRASVSNTAYNTAFSGTPRSFTERLMMEDALMKNKEDAKFP
ncbi:hypothetical protein G7Z17_g13284 [Cylindrodendrum hubeiense]|uniref:Uncharacterized protein n=1 Tax=Cylindrodendrum hubeiense TaxID=595255 RepID=A0A9P5GW50_9HYPO|nr:hypothetical protein G7Z17_g13284 [Cylindrodendrum hubeiense]